MHIVHAVELEVGRGEKVPGILQIPRTTSPVPGVLLLHGFSSQKERLADSVGRGLIRGGVASLAIDLPLRGSREAAMDSVLMRRPMELIKKWRLAVREAHASLRFMADQPAIDARRIAIAGYSLGAYLALIVGATDKLVCAVALAAGGDLPPDMPYVPLVRAIVDPLRAARALDGRPLLQVHGRRDRTIPPAQAQALYSAALEPKELCWYDGGHWPPASAINYVAQWLVGQLCSEQRVDASDTTDATDTSVHAAPALEVRRAGS